MQILEACTLCAREIEGVSDLAQRAGSRWISGRVPVGVGPVEIKSV